MQGLLVHPIHRTGNPLNKSVGEMAISAPKQEVTVNQKTKLYIWIGVGILILTLLTIAVVVHLRGGDASIPGAAAAIATAVAARAATSRTRAMDEVKETVASGDALADKVEQDAEQVAIDMSRAEIGVTALTRDEKEDEGNQLFGLWGGSRDDS
jgi:hypothetical protein